MPSCLLTYYAEGADIIVTTLNATKLTECNGTHSKPRRMNRNLDSMSDILTAQDIADYLHISRRRVYELFQFHPSDGGIPNFDIGNSKRVDKHDFIAWIEALKLQKQNKKSA
ncbi:helix-turn-helix domain-containing protein [Dendrosporobacter sp. 1207_IL3150]